MKKLGINHVESKLHCCNGNCLRSVKVKTPVMLNDSVLRLKKFGFIKAENEFKLFTLM